MAITQKNIIEQIPHRIYTHYHPYMPDSGDVLLVLRSLCHAGWGTKSTLYKALDECIAKTYEETDKNIFVFSKEKMCCFPLVCEKCNDSGYYINHKDSSDFSRYPCTECQINKPKRGELGKVLDAIKAFKKSPSKTTSAAIDDAMKGSNWCATVEVKVWRLITAVANQKRPLAYHVSAKAA